MIKRVFFVFVILCCNQVQAQNYFERVMHIGANNVLYEGDFLHSAFVLSDNSFVVGGNDKGNNNNKGAFMLKLSPKGDSLWTKFYGFDGAKMIRLNNGHFMMAGIDTNASYITSLRLLELDSIGNIINDIKPTYKTQASTDYFLSFIQNSDSSFLFTNYSNTTNGFASTLTKFNKDFSLAWQLKDTSFSNAYIRKALMDEQGNICLIASEKLGLYKYQANFMKLSLKGEILLSKSIISNRSYNLFDFMFDNRNLLCMGVGNDTVMSGAPDKALFIKMDTLFNPIWTKYYSPYTPWYGDNLTSITKCKDGNYALCGSITRKINSGINYLGCESASMIKVGRDGKMLWANVYDNGQTYFANNQGWYDGTRQVAQALVQNSNGDFLLVGGKEFLFDNNNLNRGFQSYIVFANDSGYLGKNKPVSDIIEASLFNSVLIYPNPTTSKVHIDLGNLKMERIEVLDNTGKLVLKEENNDELDLSEFGDGLYIVRCYTFDKCFTNKIVLKH